MTFFQVRLLALCNVFSFSLPSCSIPRTEFSCITAPVAYAAMHYSNPMPAQTQAFSLLRSKRYSLLVNYCGFFCLWPPESCIIVANMDDKFFLQTSPDTYYPYEPPLVFRAYRPLIFVCCLYCYNRGTRPLPLGLLPPCRIRSFFFNTLCLHDALP